MAYDQLDQPFWIKKYLISPMGQTVEGSGTDQCIQYRIHISMPKLEPEKPVAPVAPAAQSESAHPQVGVRLNPNPDGSGSTCVLLTVFLWSNQKWEAVLHGGEAERHLLPRSYLNPGSIFSNYYLLVLTFA